MKKVLFIAVVAIVAMFGLSSCETYGYAVTEPAPYVPTYYRVYPVYYSYPVYYPVYHYHYRPLPPPPPRHHRHHRR